jgi:hypothetical protein
MEELDRACGNFIRAPPKALEAGCGAALRIQQEQLDSMAIHE